MLHRILVLFNCLNLELNQQEQLKQHLFVLNSDRYGFSKPYVLVQRIFNNLCIKTDFDLQWKELILQSPKLLSTIFEIMTFVSKSPKYPPVYQSTLRQIGKIGPGSYNTHKLKNMSDGNAPRYIFNSKIQRVTQFNGPNSSSQMVEIGPGKYDSNQAYCKFSIRKQTHACQSAFKSNLQRFPQNNRNQSQEKPSQPTIYEYLLQQGSDQKKIGKLYGISRDRNKINQSIPSIPNQQQSYGYRIDPKTKMLVQNQNPNVLLARKTFMNNIDPKLFMTTDSCTGGPGSYFIKDPYYNDIKGPKWHHKIQKVQKTKQKQNNLSQRKTQPEVIEENSVYDYNNKKWVQKGNIIACKQNRFDYQKISKKNQLLMNALKKKFQYFISQGEDIEKIIAEGENRKKKMILGLLSNSQHIDKQLNQIQCFNSRQDRFFRSDIHRKDTSYDKIEGSTMINDSNIDKSITKLENHEENSKKKVKSNFGSNSQRFDNVSHHVNNKRLGPGSYYRQDTQNSPQKGSIWSKQQQKRFQIQKQNHQPGPGYYKTELSPKNKQILPSRKIKNVYNSSILQQNKPIQKNQFCMRGTYNKNEKKPFFQQQIKQQKNENKAKIYSHNGLIRQIKTVLQQYA